MPSVAECIRPWPTRPVSRLVQRRRYKMRCLRSSKLPLVMLVLLLTNAIGLDPPARLRAADHGDAPLTAHDLGADLNDLYLFRDPNDNSRISMIITVHGVIVPGGNSNFGVFDPAIRYR